MTLSEQTYSGNDPRAYKLLPRPTRLEALHLHMTEMHSFDSVAWGFFRYMEDEGRGASLRFLEHLHAKDHQDTYGRFWGDGKEHKGAAFYENDFELTTNQIPHRHRAGKWLKE